MDRVEPISMHHAGGMMQPPVQKLVATIRSAKGRTAIDSRICIREGHPPGGLFLEQDMDRVEPISMHHAGGMMQPPVQKLVATIRSAKGRTAIGSRIPHEEQAEGRLLGGSFLRKMHSTKILICTIDGTFACW